jgi:hypothetical protein
MTMLKPASWLLAACLGVAAAGCHRAATDQPQAVAAADTLAPPPGEAPASVRLAIQLVAMRLPASRTPSAPKVVEPSHDLYDTPGAKPPAEAAPADPPGFRLTVPLCRRAERLNDPLAKTAECAQLIEAAKAQAEACRQAFEHGDDKSALSPACRQAAGFR